MFDKNKESLKRISRIALVFVVSLSFTWFTLIQAEKIQSEAQEISQESNVLVIFRAIGMFNAFSDMPPHNPNDPFACRIGVKYQEDICLSELFSEGYLDLASISTLEHEPVYWKSTEDDNSKRRATDFIKNQEIFECASTDKVIWCVGS